MIYLGGNRILEALQTGENVRDGMLSEFFETLNDPQFVGTETAQRRSRASIVKD